MMRGDRIGNFIEAMYRYEKYPVSWINSNPARDTPQCDILLSMLRRRT